MVEVPEYLLERSRQRRAELTGVGLPDSDADKTAAAGSAASTAPAAPTTPALPPGAAPLPVPPAAPPPPPKPDAPYITAARARKKMPVWAASVMVFLPIWAIFYVGMLESPTSEELVLAEHGSTVYSTCASCHGGDGVGSATGRPLNNGEVLLTFPAKADFDGLAHHLSWVYLGTAGTKGLGIDRYGDPDRPDGQREVDSFASGMSGFANLSLEDLASVVYFERVTHGGLEGEQAALEEEMLLALVEDQPTFETGSPEEISELLAESATAHGIELVASE